MATVNLNLIPVDETQLVLAAGDDTQLVLSAGDETQIVLSSVAISNGLMMTDGSNSALSLGSAGTPSLKFAGDANTGIFSPGADQFSVTTGGTERLRIDGAGQIEAVSLGSAAAPTFSFTSDPNTGVYSPGADQLAIGTAGTGRLFVTSGGNVGIGASSPGLPLDVVGGIRSQSGTIDARLQAGYGGAVGIGAQSNDPVLFIQNATERFRIDTSGRLGIGTSSPVTPLEVSSATNTQIRAVTTDATGVSIAGLLLDQQGSGASTFIVRAGSNYSVLGTTTNTPILFTANNTERARIDSSGRLLVGTSSSVNTLIQAGLQVQSTGANAYASIGRWDNNAANPGLIFNKSRGGSVGTLGVVQSGDSLGEVSFAGDDGSAFISSARIQAQVDGTPGTNDMPGRLVFSTTADGAASPTERMRIKSTGIVNIANTPTYADNAAATAGGLVAGDIYRTSTGQLMIRY